MMKVPQFNKQVAISLLVTFPYANLLAMDTPDVSDNSPRDTSHTTETTMYSFNLPWGGIPHFSKKTVIKDDSEPEKINDKDTPLSDSPWALPHNPCKIMFKEFGFGKSEKKIDAVKFTDCFLDILEIKDPTGYGRKIMFVKLPTKIGMSFLFRYAEESASVITKKEFKTFQKHATKQYVKSFIFPTFNANCSISTKEQKNREKFSAYLIKHQNQVIKADYITPDNIMVKEKGLKINIHSLFSVAPMGTMKNIDYLFGRSYLIGGNL